VLITAGVFLGLAGEGWRESREHRELAEQSLRRFREEVKSNRQAVLRVHQMHQDQEKAMIDYFNANGPALMASMLDPRKPMPAPVPDVTTDSAVFDYSTWDVAVATESLAYIDPEVVAMISDAQRMQQMIEEDHRAIAQVLYSFQNQVHYLVFQLIADLSISLFALADGIHDVPFAYFRLHTIGKLRAAHVDDEIELRHTYLIEILWKLIVNIDVFGFHDLFGQWLHNGGRGETGARRFEHVGTIFSRKALRHLASA